MEVLKPMNVV